VTKNPRLRDYAQTRRHVIVSHHVTFATLLFLFIIIPAALGAYIFFQGRQNRMQLALVAIAPLAIGVILWSASYTIAASPLFDWNAGKIAPVVAMVKADRPDEARLYQDPSTGVMTGWIYGPVSALLFLPAAMFARPTDVIIAGAAINALVALAPACWFHVRATSRQALPFAIFASAAFIVFCLQFESLRRAVFMIAPDGPALGLATASCAMLIGRKRQLRHLVAAALLISLSVWSKQTFLPAIVVAPVYLALVDGRRAAMRYLVILLIVFAIVSIALIASFDPSNMYFHMVTLPRLHPWRNAANGKLMALVLGLRDLIIDGALPLICVAIVIALGRKSLRDSAISSGWIMLPILAIALLPASVLGYVKVGGFLNNFALTNFFVALAATVGAIVLTAPMLRIAICATIFIYAANIAIVRRDLPAMASRIANPYGNQQETAYRYVRQHPGVAYFPWNNLSTLLAERRLYHFEWGFPDRFDAGLKPSPQQIVDHVPPRVRIIAFPQVAQSEFALSLFPFATAQVTIDELPGFIAYTAPAKPK